MSKLRLRTLADDVSTEQLYDVLFKDNTFYLSDSKNQIIIKNNFDYVCLTRSGEVRQEIKFKLGEMTDSFFETSEGILFEFQIQTKKLFINNEGFLINYDLFQDYNYISSHKIIGKILK